MYSTRTMITLYHVHTPHHITTCKHAIISRRANTISYHNVQTPHHDVQTRHHITTYHVQAPQDITCTNTTSYIQIILEFVPPGEEIGMELTSTGISRYPLCLGFISMVLYVVLPNNNFE